MAKCEAQPALDGATSVRWRRILHLGPSRRELAAWCDKASRNAHEAHARAKAAEKELRRIRRDLIDSLVDPTGDATCDKIRIQSKELAERFLLQMTTEVRENPADYHTYQCRRCPRSPVTMERHWHVGHRKSGAGKVAAAQRRGNARERRRTGDLAGTIRSRLDRETVARLTAPEGGQQ